MDLPLPPSRRWTAPLRRLGLAASLALALSPVLTPAAPAHAAAPASVAQGVPPTLEDFKQTLTQFGTYIYSERYGNVWRPTSLPQGWHPYPACHWVYDRTYGWTYDDPTPWGRIVHHYGRWAHDDDVGWVWIPGAEWASAWVVWRTDAQWSGWAPAPPPADRLETTLAAFNSDKQWTFIETAKLANRCDAEPATPPPGTFAGTTILTTVKIVRGVAAYMVPPPPGVTIVDFDTGPIGPWPSAFLGDWITLLGAAASSAPVTLASAALCQPAEAPPPPPGVAPAVKPGGKRRRVEIAPPPPPPPPRIKPRRPVIVEDGPPAYEPPPRYEPAPYQPPRYRPPNIILTFPGGPGRPRRPYPGSEGPTRFPGGDGARPFPGHDGAPNRLPGRRVFPPIQ